MCKFHFFLDVSHSLDALGESRPAVPKGCCPNLPTIPREYKSYFSFGVTARLSQEKTYISVQPEPGGCVCIFGPKSQGANC